MQVNVRVMNKICKKMKKNFHVYRIQVCTIILNFVAFLISFYNYFFIKKTISADIWRSASIFTTSLNVLLEKAQLGRQSRNYYKNI